MWNAVETAASLGAGLRCCPEAGPRAWLEGIVLDLNLTASVRIGPARVL
jgi:hypothetical protein